MISTIMAKLEMVKNIHLKMGFFCHLQIQSKLLYKHLTFALHWLVHKLQVCKLVSIEFAPSNVSGRQFSNLQMDIFCHFNFWHNRKKWLQVESEDHQTRIAWKQPKCINKQPMKSKAGTSIQVNLCQKLLFLHQLTHNMMTDCSLNYKFNAA